MSEEIVNRVAQSGLKTLDLATLSPSGARVLLDIVPWLHQGVMLREKPFRQHLKDHDWRAYRDAYVALHCSRDAIVPGWAYMLVTTFLHPHVKTVVQGDLEALETALFYRALERFDAAPYRDARVIIKGCADTPLPQAAFVALVQKLLPVARSILYGEACSTVPLFKRKSSSGS